MIADIEFRWVMRNPTNSDSRLPRSRNDEWAQPVLQFRTQVEVHTKLGGGFTWTDWLDVPVGEEG